MPLCLWPATCSYKVCAPSSRFDLYWEYLYSFEYIFYADYKFCQFPTCVEIVGEWIARKLDNFGFDKQAVKLKNKKQNSDINKKRGKNMWYVHAKSVSRWLI